MEQPKEKFTVGDGGPLVDDIVQLATKHIQTPPTKGDEFSASLREIYNTFETFEERSGLAFDPVAESTAVSRYAQLLDGFVNPAPASSRGAAQTPAQRQDAFFDSVVDLALSVVGELDRPRENVATTSPTVPQRTANLRDGIANADLGISRDPATTAQPTGVEPNTGTLLADGPNPT